MQIARCAPPTRCSACSRGCSIWPQSRVTASQVLDLADTEPVRRRFAFDDDELARLHDWVVSSEIHWGLDEAGRGPYRLGGLAYGTWRAGLRRLLLGVALSESERSLYEGVLPLDDVDSGAIDLAGRFAELIERLGTALDRTPGATYAERVGDHARRLHRRARREQRPRRVATRRADLDA